MVERESDRSDQTLLLGKRLSGGQERVYRQIYLAGINPITAEDLYEEYYGNICRHKYDRSVIHAMITRIRQRLGAHSIITMRSDNSDNKEATYITRRALIEQIEAW